MPFAVVLPFVIVGVVIAILRKSVEQNKRQEAQRRAAQMQQEQTVTEGQATYKPVKPSVQVPPVRKASPAWAEGTAPKGSLMHQGHDLCALKKEDPKAKNKHPEHDLCALEPDKVNAQNNAHKKTEAPNAHGVRLDFTPDQILNGVILSEILGKPKALR